MNEELLQRASALCAAVNDLPDYSTFFSHDPSEISVVKADKARSSAWKSNTEIAQRFGDIK